MKSGNWMAPSRFGPPPARPALANPFQAYEAANRLRQQGRLPEAEQLYRTQLKLTPHHPHTLHCLAVIHIQRGDLGEAERLLRKTIKKNPKLGYLYNTLGYVLQGQRRYREAEANYRRAIALDPGFAIAMNNLGNTLISVERHEEAVAWFEKALAIKPDAAEVHHNLAGALLRLDRYEEAIATCDRALAIRAGDPNTLLNKGVALATLGRTAEARRVYEQAADLAPRTVRIHFNLADVKRFGPDDRHLRQMENLASNLGALSEQDRMGLHFALGKAYMDLDQRDRAFRHLLDGNALKRQIVEYDEAEVLRKFDRTREVFSRELMAEKQGSGDSSEAPVFVLGMPRSGTTLIEQILASHPKVFGAGELSDFAQAVAKFCQPQGPAAPLPDGAVSFGPAELRGIGARYIETVRTSAPDVERIVDKMPANFQFIGLIRLALPNARIIHCRRDPLDTCLSCFSKLFTGDQSFSYDLAELGRYYRAYERLMEYWQSLLPEGAMLEVDYETVVGDLEGQARRLLDYCGLAWDDACLAFHATERPVRTASAAQVRQPIYRSSVGRWQPYRHLLAPLMEALEIEPASRVADC
ncbi:MAG: sulfotransferase [Stellaceae bacterium]